MRIKFSLLTLTLKTVPENKGVKNSSNPNQKQHTKRAVQYFNQSENAINFSIVLCRPKLLFV